MAIEKNIQARVTLKVDTEVNWNKAINFIPKKNELIIYDIDDTHPEPRFKFGDGTTTVGNLPFRFDAITNSDIDEVCNITE